jgi:primary-amine oxidase
MHPLDPLTAAELREVRAILDRAGRLPESVRLPLVTLHEPPKAAVRRHDAGAGEPVERQAFVVCFDLTSKQTSEAVVSLTHARVVSWTPRPGVAPALLVEERDALVAAIRGDARWQASIRRRGVDPARVVFQSGPGGRYGTPWDGRRRLLRFVGFVRERPEDNYYAHPIDNLVAIIDADAGEVLEIQDEDPLPVPAASGNFDAAAVGPPRRDLKPLEIVQPAGPSFKLHGHELRWQKWRLRLSLHPVEGLVLHTVAYDDGEPRSILYRASVAEMVVPYGDTALTQFWRNAFDAGEVGLGKSAQSLELGCDCLGEIRYLDADFCDDRGEPYTVRDAICIHEEDAGVAWKHVGVHVATSEVRRSRRLVISHFSTIGNYDYGFYWSFYVDGSVEVEVKLTGIVYTAAFDTTEPEFGTVLAPHLYAPHHQHIFCFRLDFDLDGETNTVHEVDAVPLGRARDNPYGNAFRARVTRLTRESQAQRLAAPSRARYWKIVNERVMGRHGQPVGYKLVPQASARLLADPESHVARLAGFATKHLWVTPYAPEERYPAGAYPVWGDAGLPAWTAADRSVEDTDVVVWHTVAATHIVRPEDWPVMPVERVGFTLRPAGFFAHNPALDLPAATRHCHAQDTLAT